MSCTDASPRVQLPQPPRLNSQSSVRFERSSIPTSWMKRLPAGLSFEGAGQSE